MRRTRPALSQLFDRTGLIVYTSLGGTVTLFRRFGSAANLNATLHCLMLDGVYRVMALACRAGFLLPAGEAFVQRLSCWGCVLGRRIAKSDQ